MGLLDFLSPALTAATTAYGAQQGAEAKGKQDDFGTALQALKFKRDQEAAAMTRANQQSEITHRRAEDAAKGIVQGTPATPEAMHQFDDQASQLFDTGVPGLPNAYESMKASDPEKNAPDRFQSIGGGLMQDTTKTPEAVATRRMTAQDTLREKRDREAADRRDAQETLRQDRADARLERTLAARQEPVQIMQGTDKDGNPHFYRVPKVAGEATEVGGLDPKVAGGVGGSTGAQAPVGDMVARLSEIEQHAKDLGAGKWQMTPTMQAREGLTYAAAVNSAGGHPSYKEPLAAGVMDALHVGGRGGDDFKRYQALMNSTRAFGDDAAKVFKGRQNEDAVKREIALAELTPDDYGNPDVVEQKLSRMRHVVELAKMMNPAQTAKLASDGAAQAHLTPGDAGTPPAARPALTPQDRLRAKSDPKFAAWLRSNGYTP